jgi:group I intron endonuclease
MGLTVNKERQAALKREYKETKLAAGVYQIKNTVTGKIFIGSSVNVEARINRHKAELGFGSEGIPGLQADWNKYGSEKFTFDVLEVLDDEYESDRELKEDLRLIEQLWLEKCKPFGDKGYNERES